MSLHRQNADLSGLETEQPWRLRDAWRSLVAVAFIIGALLLAQVRDGTDSPHVKSLMAMEQADQVGPKQIAAAYERGLNDAMEAVRGKPEGVALAQACLAQGARR